MTKKLKLPIVRKDVAPPRSLSMDDYLKFVNLHFKYGLNRKSRTLWKMKQIVKVPFSLFHAHRNP
jgi:hypothetical protein